MNDAKQVVLHIGLDKAGSTALQRACVNLREELEGYGVRWLPSKFAHHGPLHQAVKESNWRVVEQDANDIRSSSQQCHVVSFEGFYHLNGNALDRFLSYFDDFSVDVVLYLRERSDKLRSGLGQRLKFLEGPSLDLIRKVYSGEAGLFATGTADYQSIVYRWEEATGKLRDGKLSVSLFERSSMPGGDIVVDFFVNHLGLGQGDAERLARLTKEREERGAINPSLSPAAQDLMALCSMLTVDKRKYRLVREVVEKYDPKEEKKHSRVPDEFLEKLDAELAEGDREIANKYFGRDQLFLEPPSFKYADASPETFQNLARNVLAEADRFKPLQGEHGDLDGYVGALRKAANSLEASDVVLAKQLMELANCIRPSGPAIKKKLNEYKVRLDQGE